MPLTDIDQLTPHPKNARRGDVDLIADSLRRHGQYRPVIIDSRSTILAGHHIVLAARTLGWKRVDVHVVDVDPATADAIVVADNRLSDIATYDVGALADLLHSLPNLAGTGFDASELAKLESDLLNEPGGSKAVGSAGQPPEENVAVKAGRHRFHVKPDPFGEWRAALIEQSGTAKAARRTIRAMLGIAEPEKVTSSDTHSPDPARVATDVETVPCGELIPFPGNAREGDIGAIAASLERFGQYKPLVINKDNTVLAGNHTLAAAQALGWSTVQVVRVHVDDEEATKITLVDNRASDVAAYDDESLRTLVGGLSRWDGTGYDLEDVNDLVSGGASRPTKASRTIGFEIGDIKFRVQRAIYDSWSSSLPEEFEETEIASRLGIAVTDCVFN